jgi:hypothetical protein
MNSRPNSSRVWGATSARRRPGAPGYLPTRLPTYPATYQGGSDLTVGSEHPAVRTDITPGSCPPMSIGTLGLNRDTAEEDCC